MLSVEKNNKKFGAVSNDVFYCCERSAASGTDSALRLKTSSRVMQN